MEANNKAMREALEIAKSAICHHAKYICQSLSWENGTINANCADILCAHRELCEAKTAIQKALSAPPRNCDDGTAQEQEKRFYKFCVNNADPMDIDGWICDWRCPLYKYHPKCKEAWAHMPYEKGETNGR